MKELYIAPELNVICFAPVERLANEGEVFFGTLLDASGHKESAGVQAGDLELDL